MNGSRRSFAEWCRLGCSRSEFSEHRGELDLRNLDMVRANSTVMLVVFGIFIGLSVWERGRYPVAQLAVAALLTLPLHTISGIKYRSRSTKGTQAMVVLITLIAYASAILTVTESADRENAVVFIFTLVLAQFTFDIPPLTDLAMSVPAYAVFAVLCVRFKEPYYWRKDLLCGALALVVGFILANRKSRLQMANIVAESRLREVNYQLYHSSTTDELTGMSNRRQVFAQMDTVRAKATENGNYIACVVMDVDDFKLYNDHYGHPAGDRLLKRIGHTFAEYCEERGLTVGRIGGEEFLAVWEETDPARCEEVAEQLRLAVMALGQPHEAAGGEGVVTVSAGACAVPAADSEKLYFITDKALYRAKERGKNCSFRYLPQTREYQYVQPLRQAADVL